MNARLKINSYTDNELIHLGMIANLVGKFKGIHIILAALNILKGQFPNIKLHILGDGEQQP